MCLYCLSCTAIGNGGKTDKLVWTQSLSELTVNVPVPAGTKTKALDVVFTNTKLKVCFGLFLLEIFTCTIL
jgi:hypothetical protein